MTVFETSCYYKKEGKIIGAEVKIYNENGDTIDRILVTDANGLEQLEDKLNNLDSTYIDKGELVSALRDNVFDGTEVTINANTFDGHDSSYYAPYEHDHQGQFASKQHASTTPSTYGAGTSTEYGHVRVRDDLTARNPNISEALSSHQGYELNNRLATIETSQSTLAEQYYRNSLRIKIGRWSDGQGEEGTRIQVNEGSGDGIYAKIYCDKPDYAVYDKEVILVLNGIPYSRKTDENGKTGKLQINLSKGTYLLTAFRGGYDGVHATSDQKIIQVL